MNLSAGPAVTVHEFRMAAGHGYADYMLFVEGKVIGALGRPSPLATRSSASREA